MRPQITAEHPRVVASLQFVEQLARRVAATMPHSIDIGDLVQDGVIGLIDAAHRFDESRGIKFETFAERRIRVGSRSFAYDYLVLAAGATHAYFGHDEWAKVAPGLKSIEDALELRRRILLAFETAELEDHPEARCANLTFGIVGAGAIAEIAGHTLPRDYRHIDTRTTRVAPTATRSASSTVTCRRRTSCSPSTGR